MWYWVLGMEYQHMILVGIRYWEGYLSNFATGSLKFPFFSKWPFLLIWRFLFLSEIRKTSVRLVVPFAKNTTHPHPHHPPNDEIRLINTSVPKIKSWNCSITFFSSQTFCWDIMKIVTTKLSVQNCVWGISGEKEAHPRKV